MVSNTAGANARQATDAKALKSPSFNQSYSVMKLKLCLLLALSYTCFDCRAQTDSIAPNPQYTNPTAQTFSRMIPLIGVGSMYNLSNKNIALLRHNTFPQFHTKLDDYAQFAPLAIQIGLHLVGTQGRSKSSLEMLSADAISGAIMMSLVSLGKYTSHVKRPDGSTYNSFPSGHTAMAFASARMLDLEYGYRYPWLARIGYATAMGVGAGRIINNRHWIGDVVTGAFVGILSAEIGYWINDKLWKRGAYSAHSRNEINAQGMHIVLPWSIGLDGDGRWTYTGIGFRHELDWYRLVWQAELGVNLLEINNPPSEDQRYKQDKQIQIALGKAWGLWHPSLSIDTMIGSNLRHFDKLSPFIKIAPRWQMTKRIGLHLDLRYTYDKQALKFTGSEGRIALYNHPQWTIGSTLNIRI